MRVVLILLAACMMCCSRPASPPSAQDAGAAATAEIRRAPERRYEENRQALLAKDFAAVMALRTEDFHAVTPDGAVHDRAQMEMATRTLLDGIERWIGLSFEIDSLEVAGDLAHATVRQHADRMARRNDGMVHHLETWVTQRETWRRTPGGWKMHRVDSIRDQRRLIDGQLG